MRSRAVREGSVGLLILVGLICIVGIAAWLRGAKLGGSYALAIELSDAVGLDVGSSVKYRGVKVGRVNALTPSINGVVAEVAISPPSTVIPRDSTIAVTQSGFIGQVELSIQPKRASQALSQSTSQSASQLASTKLSPYKPECNASAILCDGDRLNGTVGANFDTLIQSTTKLANLLTENELIDNANTALKTFSKTAQNLTVVSRNANRTFRDVSQSAGELTLLSRDTRQELRQIGPVVGSVGQAATRVGAVSDRLGTTATNISGAASQVTSLVQTNRGSIVSTLGNVRDASQELKIAVGELSPVISRLEKGKLIDNLETLAENGAKASASLNNLTAAINDPATVSGLAQTLDSARVTFQNTQKITTDLEQITGNPQLRQNLIRLINGLGKLVSSSQVLDRQLTAVREPPVLSPRSLLVSPEPLRSDKLDLETSPAVLRSDSTLLFSSNSASATSLILHRPSFTEPSLLQSLNTFNTTNIKNTTP
jgi:phospholipid/cholesterol/gamma-HCH transport system substrate-binding protein